MAAWVAALAAAGALPWGRQLRFAGLLKGFLPQPLDVPAPWPVPGPMRAVILSGAEDPLFPGGVAHANLAAAFPADGRTERVIPGLGHVPAHRPEDVALLLDALDEVLA